MFANLKLSTRLALAFGFVAAAFVGMSLYAVHVTDRLADEWLNFGTAAAARRAATSEMTRASGEAVHMFKDYVLRGQDYDKRSEKALEALDETIARYRKLGVSGEEAADLNQVA